MHIYSGRFCTFKEIMIGREFELLELMKNNDQEYRKYVFNKEVDYIPENFNEELLQWFKKGRVFQFLVYPKNIIKTVGTIFFYAFNTVEKTIKCSCFFESSIRKHPLVAESLAASIILVCDLMQIYAVRFSVYIQNEYMHKIANKLGASIEDQNHEVIKYMLHIELITIFSKKLNKLLHR